MSISSDPPSSVLCQVASAERSCRRALSLYPRIVSLPLYPAMSEEQVRYASQDA